MINHSQIRRAILLLVWALATPTFAAAQDNPLSYHAKFMYSAIKLWVVASAEKMPEEHFSFKPTPEVRSFGEILGHVADNQYRFCGTLLGEKSPTPNIEKTKTSKSELIAAVKDAFAYCDRVYDGMTDAAATDIVKLGPGMPRLGVLTVNILHSTLHYGNLITYMRLKNIVPPSSDPAFVPQPPKK
jgi:uncharacterized damage-inducible protein DinB